MLETKNKWIDKIEKIVDKNKWVQNNISMGRVQFSKLVRIKEKLHLIIASDSLKTPLYSIVQKIIINNNEIFVLYDGEYPINLYEKEYDEYKEFFSREEWENLFNGNITEYLQKNNMINDTEGYYIAIHEKSDMYIQDGFDKEDTEEVCKYYVL